MYFAVHCTYTGTLVLNLKSPFLCDTRSTKITVTHTGYDLFTLYDKTSQKNNTSEIIVEDSGKHHTFGSGTSAFIHSLFCCVSSYYLVEIALTHISNSLVALVSLLFILY